MKKLRTQRAIAITYTNMTRELEAMINVNHTIASQIKLEKLREGAIKVYLVELEDLTISSPAP